MTKTEIEKRLKEIDAQNSINNIIKEAKEMMTKCNQEMLEFAYTGNYETTEELEKELDKIKNKYVSKIENSTMYGRGVENV